MLQPATFSVRLKNELLETYKAHKVRGGNACAYGLLLFAQRFAPHDMGISTEHKGIARMYAGVVSGLVRLMGSIDTTSRLQVGKTVYELHLSDPEDNISVWQHFVNSHDEVINPMLLGDEVDYGAFLAGAFLACGGMSDPQKSYHLEFVMPRDELTEPFCAILSEMGYPSKLNRRRGQQVVYFKDSEQIEGLLAVMGAPILSMELMNIKIYKEVRNKANRQSNCDTANIDKSVLAGQSQIDNIKYIEQNRGLSFLSDDLRELAEIRLENPEASLRELGEMMNPPLSRSGVNHRFLRLEKITLELIGEGGVK